MKKDIEWLKKWVEEYENKITNELGNKLANDFMTTRLHGGQSAVKEIKYRINQLDEPEFLSQKWISKNVEYAYFDMLDGSGRLSSATAIIKPKKLKNLLVPKQEKVKIPYFIEEHIQSSLNYSEESTVVGKIENYMLPRIDETETDSRVLKFFNTTENIDLVALAMITEDYEVEKGQRYYVLDTEDIPLLERANNQTCKTTTGLSIYEDGRDNSRFELTEQEIKDYDERYWPFAVKVEEMEE